MTPIAVESDLQVYLQQINEAPLLSAEEEKALAEIIQDVHDRTDDLHEFLDPLRSRPSRTLDQESARRLQIETTALLRKIADGVDCEEIPVEEAFESGLPYVKLLAQKHRSEEDGDFKPFAERVFKLAVKQAVSARKAVGARDKMIRSNLRLVVNIAKTFSKRGMPLADLIEEGNLGLLRAVEGYDPGHDTRFSTYASWWIKQGIKRALINASRPVHIPAYMVEMIAKWKQAQKEFQENEGRQPSLQELADYLKMSKRKVRIIKQAVKAFSSPTQTGDDEGGLGLSELLTDEKTPAPEEPLFTQGENEMVRKLLDQIDAREATILRFRYGLEEGAPPLTLKEVGVKVGLTRERVRQIEREALRKLNEMISNE